MANEYKDISHRGNYFLGTLDKENKDKFQPFLKNFELSCILSSFDESLLVIPFPLEEKHLIELQAIHNYIRQLIIARLGEKMLYNAVYKTDKTSDDHAATLIKRITKDPTENQSGGFPTVPEIHVNFTKVKA